MSHAYINRSQKAHAQDDGQALKNRQRKAGGIIQMPSSQIMELAKGPMEVPKTRPLDLKKNKANHKSPLQSSKSNFIDDTIKDQIGYKIFCATDIATRFINRFQSGDMKNNILEYRAGKKGLEGGQAGSANIFLKNENRITHISKITAADISPDVLIYVKIQVDEAKDIKGANTLGHETFLHVERKINKISRILKNKSLTSIQKAKMIYKTYEESQITYNGKILETGGGADHARILNGTDKSYLRFKKELLNNASTNDKNILMKEYKRESDQYFKDAWIRWQAKVGEYENKK